MPLFLGVSAIVLQIFWLLFMSTNLTQPVLAHDLAEWTSWFNIDHPGGNGDYERLEAIRFYYRERVCQNPLDVQARTTLWVPAERTRERVHMSPNKGFWCINREQLPGKNCSNYHIRFLCSLAEHSWSDWARWGKCRGQCGHPGYQTRRRLCVVTGHVNMVRPEDCEGQAVQGRICHRSCHANGRWSQWSRWTRCNASCGAGTQIRRRTCEVGRPKRCHGVHTESRTCTFKPCHECNLTCAIGRANEDCSHCVCEWHTLTGTVLFAGKMPLAGVTISAIGQPGRKLAETNVNGRFTVSGLCPDNSTWLRVVRRKYIPTVMSMPWGSKSNSVLRVDLQQAVKPFISKHPEDRMRFERQGLILCCKAEGFPTPNSFLWYHNNTLLDWNVYKYNNNLVLKNLKPSQTGEYYCKATNEAGSIKSKPANIYVVASGRPPCNPNPVSNLIQLPYDCFQVHSNSAFVDVGWCPSQPCTNNRHFILNCHDGVTSCCGVTKMKEKLIQCKGYTLPTKVITECGCKKCTQAKIIVRGHAVAEDNGEALRFGKILMGDERIGMTGYKGTFNLQVPPKTKRLVLTFVDRLGIFVTTTKVLPFNKNGGSIFHEIKMQRKKPPVEIDSSVTNTLTLNDMDKANPMGQIEIPANAFYRTNGKLYNGTVQASVTFLDPRNMSSIAAASSDLNFVNDEGDLFPLRTYGMFSVDFKEETTQESLDVGKVNVYLDAAQVTMPEHRGAMKLWSLNPVTGIWEEEGDLRMGKVRRNKREARTFLIGNMEIRERRLFNLDVPEARRCFVKMRAFRSDRFIPTEQVQGVVISLINMEPQPGFSANPRAWGRFDSVITGPNGACLPAFCDLRQPDAYTAFVTANIGGEDLEAVPSSPKLNPNMVGVEQPYLGKLAYRRTDHDDPRQKKTAFKINLAKPNPNSPEESNGPIYAYSSLKQCEEAPFSDNHFRFFRVEEDRYQFNTVPFNENDLTTWTEDYLSWWPKPMEFRACYIKLKILASEQVMVRSRNLGGTHSETVGKLYGIRDVRSIQSTPKENISAACLEFKCSGLLFDENEIDRTMVEILPQGDCRRQSINSLLQEYLINHPPLTINNETHLFKMFAPLDPLGHNYGIYTMTDQDPKLAKEIALGRCFEGSSDSASRVMNPDNGVGVTFSCSYRDVGHSDLFKRMQTSPAATLAEIGQDMGRMRTSDSQQRRRTQLRTRGGVRGRQVLERLRQRVRSAQERQQQRIGS
uniref:cartilage intermediate layer protein 1 isoform X2 n=1 Tax=Myxine glutinosa TaxID=7769 RepID=UPI00358F343A